MPDGKALVSMLISAIVGLVAGLLSLHLLGQPTPFGA